MSTVRNLLRFLLFSSVACVVLLLLQRSADPCPCRDATRKEQASAANGTHQQLDPPRTKKLGSVRQFLINSWLIYYLARVPLLLIDSHMIYTIR
jgi:hypothetical protein